MSLFLEQRTPPTPAEQQAAVRRAQERVRRWFEGKLVDGGTEMARLFRDHRDTFVGRIATIYDRYLRDDPTLLRARSGPAAGELARAINEQAAQLADELGLRILDTSWRTLAETPDIANRTVGKAADVAFAPMVPPRDAVLGELTTRVVGGGTAYDRIFHITDGLRNELFGTIRGGLLNGDTFDTVRDRVMTTFGVDRLPAPTKTAYGAVKLYRNEARRQWNLLMDELGKQSDPPSMQIWWATLDDRTTPGCAARHGRSINALGGETPPRHVNCFVPSTRVQGSFLAGFRMLYAGKVREVHTRQGRRLTITPNHPVATLRGFVPAHSLAEGDYVVAYGRHVYKGTSPQTVSADHKEDSPTAIEQVFKTLAVLGDGVRFAQHSVDDFYGDAVAGQSDVEVTVAQRELLDYMEPAFSERIGNVVLEPRNVLGVPHPRPRPLDFALGGVGTSTTGSPHSRTLTLNQGPSGFDSLPFYPLGIAAAPDLDAVLLEASKHGGSRDAAFVRHLAERCPSQIVFDQIVQVVDRDFEGHVYDLQSVSGAIIAEGIVTSNCRCTVAIMPMGTDLDAYLAEGDAWLQAEGWTRRRASAQEAWAEAAWDPGEHPRAPVGSPEGGQFVGAGGIEAPSAGYVDAVQRDMRDRERAGDKRDIVYWLGYPARRHGGDDASLGMAEHVEKSSTRDAMLSAMGSQMSWNTNYAIASQEWLAARALGANPTASRTTLGAIKGQQLSDVELSAFRARTDYMQQWARQTYGDRIRAYRGIKGRQASRIRDADADDVDLDVYGLSSFTTSRAHAFEFAGRNGVVLETELSPDDVFGSNELGAKGITRFSDDRNELVVLNRARTRRAKVIR